MISNGTKEKKGLTFSYFDLILLILVFLVISVGIGLLWDSESNKNQKSDFYVTLETVLPEELRDGVPKEGETLFGSDGEKAGTVLSAVVSDDGAGIRLEVLCCLNDGVLGEEMTVETESFIRTMKILSVEEKKGEKQ